MGSVDGVIWRDVDDYDGAAKYDLLWLVTPEFPQPTKRFTRAQHTKYLKDLMAKMAPKVVMYMVHNGHLPDEDWDQVRLRGAVVVASP
jgi:hypothetical protein